LEAMQSKQAQNIGRKDYLANSSADWWSQIWKHYWLNFEVLVGGLACRARCWQCHGELDADNAMESSMLTMESSMRTMPCLMPTVLEFGSPELATMCTTGC
jgi:hypothetical protein